ncbi:hypothetical protein AGMMS50284_1960 [Clostridia bacterium]|nr:hypothetical protein AGMMS50284_1960 [Clostridia bacterium]
MVLYFLMLVTILLLGWVYYYLKECGKDAEKPVLIFACIFLLFFAAFRANTVGADTNQYLWVFNWMKRTPFSRVPTATSHNWYSTGQELMYKYYNKVLTYFFSNQQTITISNSILLITGLYLLIKKQSTDKWLSVFLYFTLGMYQLALNLTPSSIASLFCLAAIPFAVKKKPVQYFIIVAAAFAFHNSAIAFAPIYFLVKIKITPKVFWTIIIGSLGTIIVFLRPLITLLGILLPSKYDAYLHRESPIKEAAMVWIVHFGLFMLCWFISRKDKNFFEKNRVGVLMIVLESIFYFFALTGSIFSRAAFLYAPYLIVSIPQMLYYKHTDKETELQASGANSLVLQNQKQNTHEAVFKYILIIMFFVILQYVLRLQINNIGTTMPYKFFI